MAVIVQAQKQYMAASIHIPLAKATYRARFSITGQNSLMLPIFTTTPQTHNIMYTGRDMNIYVPQNTRHGDIHAISVQLFSDGTQGYHIVLATQIILQQATSCAFVTWLPHVVMLQEKPELSSHHLGNERAKGDRSVHQSGTDCLIRKEKKKASLLLSLWNLGHP